MCALMTGVQSCALPISFLAGLAEALQTHGMPLIGGDTVSLPKGAPGVFTLTAIGEAPASGVPARNGAQEGDVLYVTGTVGDAGLGLALAQRGIMEPASSIRAYRRPQPRLAQGREMARSEERRVGQEVASRCWFWWLP